MRLFGKVPSLRVLVAALASCIVPALSVFAILVIFIAICDPPASAASCRSRAAAADPRPAFLGAAAFLGLPGLSRAGRPKGLGTEP